ncbi:DNA polymerase III subunit delta [Congzhengia sp.]|uniref:DNA polymerase III subunit delta n=1 Tax=Congzhengia sp. TaxID=2944168 RepID=UPI0030788C85
MNYDEFVKYLKQDKMEKNVLLLYGEEVFLKAHSKAELLKKITPAQMPEFNVFEFDGRKYDLKAVDEAIEALPVMSDSKLLTFRNSMIFTISGKDTATKEYKEFWEKRLSDIPEDVFLVFDEEKVDKRSGLYKKFQKQNAFAEFSYLSENKMINWTIGLFKTLGKVISPHDAKYLIEITGEGMMAVKHEAEKVAAFTQGEIQITRADIDAVVVPVIENKVFDMVDAMLSQNAYAALSKLNDLCSLKEDETRILGAISSSVDKILTVKLMTESRLDRTQIASKSKIPPFLVSKYITLSAKYTRENLERLLTMCVDTDRNFKLSQGDKTVLLQRLIADFAG